MTDTPEQPGHRSIDATCAAIVGVFLIAWAIGTIAAFVATWQLAEESLQCGTPVTARVFSFGFPASPNVSLFLLLIASSSIGSLVHATLSYVTYVGNQSFRGSWVAWYLLRLLTGAGLAIILYLVMRAGLLTGTQPPENTSLFGVAAIGALTGLFSKQAVDKLREVFDVTFRVSKDYGDNQRKDKLSASPYDP